MIEVSKIFHIADVHVRNYKRHEEYRAVFKNLFKYLKANADKNSLIFLAGDIAHSKNDMSPELVDVIAELFQGCADIAATIVITGNHDSNLSNESRLDALTPIVRALNHPNLMYWKDTGVYEYGGISFSVFSVFGSPQEWVTADKIDAEYKIALHHGAVSNAVTDLNYHIQNEYVTPKLFEGFDLVLLGDIHKRQFLNAEQTIAYPGSLIQQDHGEEVDHGILVWDVPSKTSQYVPIRNTIAYATVEVDGGKVVTPREYFDRLPKNLRLRIKYSNSNYADINKILQSIKTRFRLLETAVVKINNYEYTKNNSVAVLGDVRDIEYQNDLITQYISGLANAEIIDIDGVRHVNRVMNAKLDPGGVVIRNVVWKLLRFEFSNMFSYGPNNEIDFSEMSGVQGLFAPNASGKSTLLDAVTFCLFDKCSRTYKARDVMNNKKTKFNCKLLFELNGEKFEIERTGTTDKRTGNVKVDVHFRKETAVGWEPLNGKDRDQTNKIIRGYVGTYDDFLLTALSTQNDNKNFIFKAQRERKDLLNSFLDISIFDDLYVITKNEIKGKQALVKNLESTVQQEQYIDLPKQIESVSKQYDKKSDQERELVNTITGLNSQITELSQQLQEVVVDGNLEDLEANLIQLKEADLDFETKLDKLRDHLEISTPKLTQLESDLTGIDVDQMRGDIDSAESMRVTIEGANNLLNTLNLKRSHLEEQINRLADHEYDPNCQYCVNNPFVSHAKQAEADLPKLLFNIREQEAYIANLVEERISILETVNPILERYEELTDEIGALRNSIQQAEQYLEVYTAKQEANRAQIVSIEKQIVAYNQEQDKHARNQILTEQIRDLQKQLRVAQEQEQTIRKDLLMLNSEVASLKTKHETWTEKFDELQLLYAELSVYEHYLDVISKNGVPYMLLEKIIPVIEDEVNSILTQIVDFYVTLETDDKNINCYIHYNDETHWPVELASGMERFMISVAMRVALINVSSLPRPNFIALDEGFGVLDADKLGSVHLLFDYLKTQFDFILCISHLDAMKDLADSLINVNKTAAGFSEIRQT